MSEVHRVDDSHARFSLSVWRPILERARASPRAITGLLVGGIVVAGIETALPLFVARIIDEARKGDAAVLAPTLIAYASLFVFFAIGVWVFIDSAGKLATNTAHLLRRDCFAKLQELEQAYFDVRPTGWLVSRLTSDCSKVSGLLPWCLLDFAWCTSIVLAVTITMFVMNAQLALWALAAVPVMTVVSAVFQRWLIGSGRHARRISSAMTASYGEMLLGARTTKALAREEENLAEFQELSTSMNFWAMRGAILSSLYVPLMTALAATAGALVLWKGTSDVLTAEGVTLGTLIAFMQFAALYAQPVQELAQRFADVLNASSAAERIQSLLMTAPRIADAPHVVAPASARIDTLRFEAVDFSYREGVPILENFSLTVTRGMTVALVGATGGGKSTIVALASRFYEPTGGRVTIDGVDLRDRPLAWFADRVGLVPQVAHLTAGSVRENIRYGRLNATDAEIEAAAQRVRAHDFILALEHGYDTDVGEGGERLSTGQRQLVALARAVLRDPEILVMDEATSSIDTATEQLVQSGVDEVLRGRIALVVAHRLSTIRRADLILVIERGCIAEQGTHRELLARRERYFDLYTSQFAADRERQILRTQDAQQEKTVASLIGEDALDDA
ncbi:MAG: ABC transporter ATP-binding protein [Phycisphaerales bacterium]|nr:ABC transporter ATP-binding protein [Phycisphaerales bacterium]